MIIGIGIDIVDKERIAKLSTRLGERFIQRILTTLECERLPAGERKVEYIAGRFSAKEAFSKALGTGIGTQFTWHDISVITDERGKPVICLSEQWQQVYDPKHRYNYHVSISHEKTHVIAQVIIEG